MNMKKVMAIGACIVACSGSATDWTAVWKSTSGSLNWSDAANWENGYVGGTAPTDNVDLAAPFGALAASSSHYGQMINLTSSSPVFSAVTGSVMQVFGRSGDVSGSVTLTDPTDFLGVWAQSGLSDRTYTVNAGASRTPTFRRLANGVNALIKAVAAKVRVRDLIGGGNVRITGEGEVEFDSPRNLDARVLVQGTGKLTVRAVATADPKPAANPDWHFDAADESTMEKRTEGGRTYVDKWYDADGGVAVAYCPKSTAIPFLSAETVNGYHLVDFGGFLSKKDTYQPADAESRFGTAAYMFVGKEGSLSPSWNNSRKIREMFVVTRMHAPNTESAAFMTPLGHNSEYYLAGQMNETAMYNTQYSVVGWNSMGKANYRAWIDGAPFINSALNCNYLGGLARWTPTELHVIAYRFDEGSIPAITALGTTRGYANEYGGMQIAEALVYSHELDDDARRETIDYLKRKWLSGTLAKPYDLGAVIVANADAKINVGEGDTAKIRTVRKAANLAGSVPVVKTGAGTLEVEELSPAATEIEVQGGDVLLSHDTPVASTAAADIPKDSMLCWIDATASAFEGETDAVTKLCDCREDKKDTVFAESQVVSGTTMPTLTVDSASGKTMLNFGTTVAATQPYARLRADGANLGKIREAFVVWRQLSSSGYPGIIGDGGRDSLRNGIKYLFYSAWSYGAGLQGLNWWVDGKPIDTTSESILDFRDVGVSKAAVISYSAMDPRSTPYLAVGGWTNGGGGGCAIGEVICYGRKLTDAERRNVTAYLMDKWQNGARLPLDADDTVSKVSFADGVAPKLGTTSDRTVGAVSGAGTLTKTGAGKLTVGAIDAAITNLDVAAGTLKTTVDWMGDAWLHLDASDLSSFEFADGASGEGAEILRWNDVRGNGLYAGSITTDTYDGFYCTKPVYRATTSTVLGGLEDMPHVDFGPMATSKEPITRGAGMFFYGSGSQIKPTDIAEFHIVFTFKAGNCAALGSDTNTDKALTPANSSYGGYWSACTCATKSAKRSNGSEWYSANYFTKPAGTCTDKFIVLSQVNTNGNIKAWSLGVDRNCGVGGVRVAEVLIFRGATNTTAKANAIHDYLYKKWKGKGEGASLPVFNGVNIASGATLELKNLGGGAVSLAKLTGAGTFKAEGVSGLGEIGATVAADGTVSCATLTGALTLAETGVVTVSLGNPKPAAGRHRILAASSVANPEAIAGWTLQVTGESKYSFSISADATGVYLNVVKPGMMLIVR